MHGNTFALQDQAHRELRAHNFVSDAADLPPESQALAAAQRAAGDQYDYNLAIGAKERRHDLRPLESKTSPNLQQGQSGNGGGGGVSGGSGGSGGSPGSGSGSSSGSGGSVSGKGGGTKTTQRGGTTKVIRVGGGGGGGLLGPNALGNLRLLGNVPAGAAGTSSSTGPSPLILIGIVAVVGVGGYFLWHKLRVARAQDKDLDKGKEPKPDAA